MIRNRKEAGRLLATLVGAATLLSSAQAWAAACRVTDFTTQPLSSLSEVQRLSFVTEMTRVEYTRLKDAAPGTPNYYKLIADSSDITAARTAAHEKLASHNLENIDDYRRLWASDFPE